MRIAAIILAVLSVLTVCGCGGDSSSRNDVIVIRDFQFDPGTTTVPLGTTMRWSNADQVTHRIVSGSLLPTPFPKTVNVGIDDANFTENPIEIELGDTVVFQNLKNIPSQVEVKNQDFDIVFLSEVLQFRDTTEFTSDTAGRFDVRDTENQSLTTRIDITGIPAQDGLFDSGTLVPGQVFEFTFDTPGTFDFFCSVHNIENGVVVVSP